MFDQRQTKYHLPLFVYCVPWLAHGNGPSKSRNDSLQHRSFPRLHPVVEEEEGEEEADQRPGGNGSKKTLTLIPVTPIPAT